MFNYTHEVIINSLNGTLAKKDGYTTFPSGSDTPRLAVYTDAAIGVKHLVIERGGDYRQDLVFPRTEGLVFKTLPIEGRLAKAEITIPTLTSGKVYNLSVFVKLLDPAAIAEYAYPNWAVFGKPIVVGITSTGTAADDAEKFADAIKEAVPYNNKFVVATVDGAKVVLKATEFGLDFDKNSIKLELLDTETGCDTCQEVYIPVEATVTVTKGVVPFGTGEKLVENYRFPTYGNRRYAALNSDETPIPGAKYVMYSFAYDSPRPGFGGLSGVGQKVDAVTRHIYWVNEACVNDFDAALTEAFGEDCIVEKSTIEDTIGDSSNN